MKETPAVKADSEDVSFSVRANFTDGHLYLEISGRLDTITAPELLSVFQRESMKGDIRSITIDSESLTYISSSGLRVFLIMWKALENGKHFQIRNMKENIKKIMNITGFSSIFDGDD